MGIVRFNKLVSDLRVNSKASKPSFFIRRSRIVKNVLNVLYQEGFIGGFSLVNRDFFKVSLKYFNNRPPFYDIKAFSKPGHFISKSRRNFLRNQKVSPFSVTIFSTNLGVISANSFFTVKEKHLEKSQAVQSLAGFYFLKSFFFLEFFEYFFYDTDFFNYHSGVNFFSENADSLRVNLSLVDYVRSLGLPILLNFSNMKIMKLFYNLIPKITIDSNFVTFYSLDGVNFCFKFMLVFLLFISRNFVTGIYQSFARGFKRAFYFVHNSFFLSVRIIDSFLILPSKFSQILHFSMNPSFYYGVTNYDFIKHNFFRFVDLIKEKNGLHNPLFAEHFFPAFYYFGKSSFLKYGLSNLLSSLSFVRRILLGMHIAKYSITNPILLSYFYLIRSSATIFFSFVDILSSSIPLNRVKFSKKDKVIRSSRFVYLKWFLGDLFNIFFKIKFFNSKVLNSLERVERKISGLPGGLLLMRVY